MSARIRRWLFLWFGQYSWFCLCSDMRTDGLILFWPIIVTEWPSPIFVFCTCLPGELQGKASSARSAPGCQRLLVSLTIILEWYCFYFGREGLSVVTVFSLPTLDSGHHLTLVPQLFSWYSLALHSVPFAFVGKQEMVLCFSGKQKMLPSCSNMGRLLSLRHCFNDVTSPF